MYLERIQKLEKELAAEKELHSSGVATIVSAVPGSETGGAPSPSPSHGADGGELSSVSVKEPVGKHASVVSGSELGSVETGVAREASPTTVIPSKVLETGPGLLMIPVVTLVIRFLIVKVEHLPLWVVIARA